MKIFVIIGLLGVCYLQTVIGDGEDLRWSQDATNVTGLCQLLDMDPDECELMLTESIPTDGVDESGEKMVVSGREESEIAGFDPCNPRMSTIVIPRHPDNDITVWPTCTRALRCGGCCTSEVFSCEPTEVREKYVKVFDTRLPYVGAHRFQFLGVRAIKIIEHLQCDAQCKTKPHECHKYQNYESRKCRCVCQPNRLKLRHNCNKEQIWDDSECDCICPNRNTVNCPEPSYFSTTTCKCTLKTEVTGEIDLDLLFAKLGTKGFLDLDLDDNQWFKGKNIKIWKGDDKDNTTLWKAQPKHNTTDENNSTTTPPDSSTSTTSTTTSTTTTTTTTPKPTTEKPTTPKVNPCAKVKCFGNWKAKLIARSGKCQCLPSFG